MKTRAALIAAALALAASLNPERLHAANQNEIQV
jgi:hypothetical protein